MANSVTAALSSSHAATQPSTTNQTTYLQRCYENLAPEKVTNLESERVKWNNLAIISTVAFFALAVGTFIATSILFPAYLPIAGISAILLAFPAVQQVQKFRSWSDAAFEERSKYDGIQYQYAKLTEKTPEELQRILLNMGIIWNRIPGMSLQHPDQLYGLNPVLAHSKYLEDCTKWNMKARDRSSDQAQGITTDLQAKASQQQYALRCEDDALRYKIKNAFYHAVLSNPQFSGTFEGLGALSKNSLEGRLLGTALNDPTANQMFVFNNNTIAPISYTEAKTMTVAELGQRFFTAMTA